ncbi:MAG TPA: hypothetical protein DCZ04_07250 [Syntrophorhabdus aromaticivorans]|nr:hypothetical protein [Syntrophorhabdus aromaticivorans]
MAGVFVLPGKRKAIASRGNWRSHLKAFHVVMPPRMAARIPEPFALKRIKRIWRGTLLGILIGIVSGPGE